MRSKNIKRWNASNRILLLLKGGMNMAYEKRTWVSGVTKCSAENFNHMEDGIETAQKGVDELNTKLTNGFVGGASSGTTNINIDSSNSNYLIVVCTGDDFSVCVASRYAGTIKFCILKDHSAVTYAQLDGRLIGINCSSAYNYSLTKLCHMIS